MSQKTPIILIVDDHFETRRALSQHFAPEFTVHVADNGVKALEMTRDLKPDLVLMDVVLPILTGMDACSLLKQDSKTKAIPIVLTSLKNSAGDIERGFKVGCNDFIPKPYEISEVKLRILNLLKLSIEQETGPIVRGELMIYQDSRRVVFAGQEIHLTTTEYDILRLLASKIGETISRKWIMNEIWRDSAESTSDRTIDVHIRALRKKIPALSQHILSIYGVGYKFVDS